jgi:hypothetical protein
MPLTTAAINAAKGHEKSYKLTDSSGLHLLVLPSRTRRTQLNNPLSVVSTAAGHNEMSQYTKSPLGQPNLSWR